MASNHSTADGVGEVQEYLADRMAAYDRLPRELREAIDDCPIEQSAIGVLKMWMMLGCDTMAALLVFNNSVHKAFPGYTPPRARPRATAQIKSGP